MEALGALQRTMLPADFHRIEAGAGLLVGVGASEEDETALLMRPVLRLDSASGSAVIGGLGEAVRPFQRLQFCMWALFVPVVVGISPLLCDFAAGALCLVFHFPLLCRRMHAFVTPVLGLTNFDAQVCVTGRHLART